MKYISSSQFKSLRKGKSDTSGLIVCKDSVSNEILEDRKVRFVISTPAVDRDNDVIQQDGWDLAWFKTNPVVLWDHRQSDAPIGRVVDIGVIDGNLCATVEFVPETNPWVGAKAAGIYQMLKQGFLAACSVGFTVLEAEETDDPDRGAGGWEPGITFIRQRLNELSICSVGCNPEALAIDVPRPAEPKSAEPDIIKSDEAEATEDQPEDTEAEDIRLKGIARRRVLAKIIANNAK